MNFKKKGACEECLHMGWAVFNDNEVQACDTCDVFEYDSDAFEHAIGLAIQILEINRSLAESRSDQAGRIREIIRALEIVVDNAEIIQASIRESGAHTGDRSIFL